MAFLHVDLLDFSLFHALVKQGREYTNQPRKNVMVLYIPLLSLTPLEFVQFKARIALDNRQVKVLERDLKHVFGIFVESEANK